jgi:predicted nucleic acid-binding protein
MTWLISDANILIDMEVGGLLDKMFRLPERFAVPDVLYLEELETHHPQLPGLGLQVIELRAEFVDEAYRLGDVYPKPGYNDLLALSLAKQEQRPLLTGDEQLRIAAEQENVTVRGTLWLIDRLYAERIVSLGEIKAAYAQMKNEGRRLPWGLIGKQLKNME